MGSANLRTRMGIQAVLLGARTLLGAPGIATRNKKLLGAPGLGARWVYGIQVTIVLGCHPVTSHFLRHFRVQPGRV